MTPQTLIWPSSTTQNQTITDDTNAPLAHVLEQDIAALSNDWSNQYANKTIIVPCGRHSQTDPEPSTDLLKNWSQDSWEPFNAAVETLTDLAQASNTQLVILPGAGGRLSDAICTLSWAAAHPDIPLLLDPIGWLTPSMIPDLNDHLIRFSSLCEELPNIWGVVLRSIQNDPSGELTHAHLEQGLISDELLTRTLRTIPTPRLIECHWSSESSTIRS